MRPAAPVAAALLAAVLLSCTSGGEPATIKASGAPGGDPVLEAREALGDPMLELAEAVIDLAEGIDAARHTVPRGTEMLRAVRALPEKVQRVRAAAGAAQQAAEQAPVAEAAAIVEDAVAVARRAARAAPREIAFLQDAAAIDVSLLAAAAAWDRPGSQSEIRERLGALAEQVGALRRRVEALRPQPQGCGIMKRNRAQWVDTVRNRTLELQTQANSAGGSEYDRLRASYRRLPLAVEPRTADRGGRDCWGNRSAVAKAAPAMRAAVDDLRASLSG